MRNNNTFTHAKNNVINQFFPDDNYNLNIKNFKTK